MARIPLVCPIDGTNLGSANANVLPDAKGGMEEETHAHLVLQFRLTCQQGHTWEATTDIVLNRVR